MTQVTIQGKLEKNQQLFNKCRRNVRFRVPTGKKTIIPCKSRLHQTQRDRIVGFTSLSPGDTGTKSTLSSWAVWVRRASGLEVKMSSHATVTWRHYRRRHSHTSHLENKRRREWSEATHHRDDVLLLFVDSGILLHEWSMMEFKQNWATQNDFHTGFLF